MTRNISRMDYIWKGAVFVGAVLTFIVGPMVAPHTSGGVTTTLSAKKGPVYDLPARASVDDLPAAALLAWQRANGDPFAVLTDVQQCGIAALWWVDDSRGADLYTELLKLNHAYTAVHPSNTGIPAGWIDDAATLLHINVDVYPHVGSVGVYEHNTNGAGVQGHAFRVDAVDTIHMTVKIDEYNWSYPNRWDTRIVPYGVAGLSFVHFLMNGP